MILITNLKKEKKMETKLNNLLMQYYWDDSVLDGDDEDFLQQHADQILKLANPEGDEIAMGAHIWCETYIEGYF